MRNIKWYIKTKRFSAVLIASCILMTAAWPDTAAGGTASGDRTVLKNFCGIEMVLVPDGSLQGFWISRYEVTQEIYETVMGYNPSYFRGKDLPIEQVSWFQAVEFCNSLSKKAGFSPYYTINRKRDDPENKNMRIRWSVTVNREADGFRLPCSDEWEYAARAGSSADYFWGDAFDESYCWYSGNSGNTTHAVGTRKPNTWGIYDMCGNVREWCFEWHPEHYGFNRIVRDGQYSLEKNDLMVGLVDYQSPQYEFGFIGIRLARNR